MLQHNRKFSIENIYKSLLRFVSNFPTAFTTKIIAYYLVNYGNRNNDLVLVSGEIYLILLL